MSLTSYSMVFWRSVQRKAKAPPLSLLLTPGPRTRSRRSHGLICICNFDLHTCTIAHLDAAETLHFAVQ
jgi:hypothetical protein